MMNLPDVEKVAAKVHEAWMDAKRARGVTSRRSESWPSGSASAGRQSETPSGSWN